MSFVGVHGIRQYKYHKDPAKLEAVWADALAKSAGLPCDQFSLAYYAPLLHMGVRQSTGSFDELSETEFDLIAHWLQEQKIPAPISQGKATRWLRDGLDWLLKARGATELTQAVIAAAFQEVAVFTDPRQVARRDAALLLVTDVFVQKQPRVLIGHSLGSVVAYEALWASPHLQVDLFLTLGSPLALPGIFGDRLDPARAGQFRKPPCVNRWINVADEGDLIALPKELNQRFEGVESDLTVTIGKVAFHGIEAYLACPEVAEVIAPYAKKIA